MDNLKTLLYTLIDNWNYAEKYKRPYRMCDSTVIYEIAKILNINLTMIEASFSANPSYHQIIAE